MATYLVVKVFLSVQNSRAIDRANRQWRTLADGTVVNGYGRVIPPEQVVAAQRAAQRTAEKAAKYAAWKAEQERRESNKKYPGNPDPYTSDRPYKG